MSVNSLSKMSRTKIFIIIIAVVSWIALIFFGYQIRSRPDIRYKEKQRIVAGDQTMATLILKNYGYKDAHQVHFWAIFSEPIVNVAMGNPNVLLEDLKTRSNGKFIEGTIRRVQADELTEINFLLENAQDASVTDRFIMDISFEGGRGKRGTPVLPSLLVVLVGLTAAVVFFFPLIRELRSIQQKNDDEKNALFLNDIQESIAIAVDCSLKNLTFQEFELEWHAKFSRERSQRDILYKSAASTFNILCRRLQKSQEDIDERAPHNKHVVKNELS